LQAADRAVADTIEYLSCTPDIAGPEPRDTVIRLEEFRNRLRISQDGVLIREVLDAHAALEFLHIRLFEYSIGERPKAAVLHAACLRRHGRRLLLAGTKGAGKSTLALHLIHAGYEIEGDEHVFVDGANAVARPRACRVKEASLPHLPATMVEVIVASPCFRDYDGERIFNVDPRAFGPVWRIEEGRVDCVFVLRPNHGAFSSVRPMQPSGLVQFLISETGVRDTDRGGAIAPLAALASSARAFDLSLGDHATAIRCVETALAAQ
jgi:hypothetical protein